MGIFTQFGIPKKIGVFSWEMLKNGNRGMCSYLKETRILETCNVEKNTQITMDLRMCQQRSWGIFQLGYGQVAKNV